MGGVVRGVCWHYRMDFQRRRFHDGGGEDGVHGRRSPVDNVRCGGGGVGAAIEGATTLEELPPEAGEETVTPSIAFGMPSIEDGRRLVSSQKKGGGLQTWGLAQKKKMKVVEEEAWGRRGKTGSQARGFMVRIERERNGMELEGEGGRKRTRERAGDRERREKEGLAWPDVQEGTRGGGGRARNLRS